MHEKKIKLENNVHFEKRNIEKDSNKSVRMSVKTADPKHRSLYSI